MLHLMVMTTMQEHRARVKSTDLQTVGRQSVDVLLLDGQYRQALTSLRALSAAGLRVGVAACASDASAAPSLRSSMCAWRTTLPDLGENPEAYTDAVIELLDTHSIGMVLPAHDGSIDALRVRRREVECRCALPLASDQALDIAVSKERTLGVAAELGIAIPETIRVTDERDLRSALASVGVPAVLKPTQSWVINAQGEGTRLTSVLVRDAEEAARLFGWVQSVGGSLLVQPWLPGAREACTLFHADGRVWARFAQVSHREWPVLGGVSVLCESVDLDPQITEWSEQLVGAIGLDGCAMVEFRRDRDGRPVLMEVNPRLGATTALALRSGVDFPGLTYRWATGEPLDPVVHYRVGRRLRWLIGDVWYLKSVFGQHGSPEVPTRWRAVATVISDFVVRPSHIDVWSLRDPWPAFVEMKATAKEYAMPRIGRWMRA
jgi:predicted ATP-grasp superfamily ATP-dependent carboligase